MNKVDLDDMVTVKDLIKIFNVTHQTIHRWRNNKGLNKAIIKIPNNGKPTIRFSFRGVLRWAKETNTPIPNLDNWQKERENAYNI